MREDWRLAMQEPFVVDDDRPTVREREDDDVPLGAVASIVAVAAMVLAVVGATVGGCNDPGDNGWIVGAAAGALLLAFVGTCVVTYRRRTWAHAATVFTGVALVFVIVGLADRTAETSRFAATGNACISGFEGGD